MKTWLRSLFYLTSVLGAVSNVVPAFAYNAGDIVTQTGNGTGVYLGDNNAATSTGLNPWGVAVDSQGNFFISDAANYVFKVAAATGIITTVAGNGKAGFSGDGGPATAASLNGPSGLAVDPAGNIYIADTPNHCIRKVTAATAKISTVAGICGTLGSSGDGGLATSALLSSPVGVTVDSSQNFYITDSNNKRIRKVAGGYISTFAGGGGLFGEGGPATQADIGIAVGTALFGGELYLADGGNRVRKVSSSGIITTVAGNGFFMAAPIDGVPATESTLVPAGVVLDSLGNLFIADNKVHGIRKVDHLSGIITTVAGNGISGFSGDGGHATNAAMGTLKELAIDPAGNLFVVDRPGVSKGRIRELLSVPAYTVTPGAGAGGSIFLDTQRIVSSSAADSFTITPVDGKHARLPIGGSCPQGVLKGTSYTTGFITADCYVMPAFDLNTVSEAPINVTGVAGIRQAMVSFSAPLYNGGSPVTGYTVVTDSGEGVDSNAGSTDLNHLVTGLSNGATYTFSVSATNGVGTSTASAPSNSVRLPNVPDAPIISRTNGFNGEVVVTFTAPANDGGSAITGYTVLSNPSEGFDSKGGHGILSLSLSHLISGLTNGKAYTFTVIATNAAGDSAPSAGAVATPATVPDAPGIGSAVAGNGQATVSFSAPGFNGGSAIVRYRVVSDSGDGVDLYFGQENFSHTVTGLTNGKSYRFSVTAMNSMGTGLASAFSNCVTPGTIPDPPIIGAAVASNGAATVSFSAPANNGGNAITGYSVRTDTGEGVDKTALSVPLSLTHLLSGLKNGQAYTVTVIASNAFGNSAASSSVVVTPATVPGAPVSALATAGNGQASVSFSAPLDNGGSDVLGYNVLSNPAGGVDSNPGGAALSHHLTGLSNGTVYTFSVSATNRMGTGSGSDASNPVTPDVLLTVKIVGTGSGTVNAVSNSFACSGSSCEQRFPPGTLELADSARSTDSIFSGWSGACSNVTGNCVLTMGADQVVNATFDLMPPLKLPGVTDSYFATLSDAVATLKNGSSVTLEGQASSFPGGYVLNKPLHLTLSGGFDAGFVSNAGGGMTAIVGGLTISQGCLTAENVAVR